MRLSGANMLELSLCIAFSLVVFATALHLIQESTERVNKGFSFQEFQQNAFNTLIKSNNLVNFNPSPNTTKSIIQQFSTVNDTNNINKHFFIYENSEWIETNSENDIIKTTISDSRFTKQLFIYSSSYKTIKNLKKNLSTIKTALNEYFIINGTYPPSYHLNYLIQTNILNNLPANPYTKNRTITYSLKNMTDWNYINSDNVITLYAYSHPNIVLSWNY